jgi:3-oxoacyl-[acyl-carrier protein] reductase
MKKTALITGGTRGIGLGIATELAGIGYDLVLSGLRPEDQVLNVIADLQKLGVACSYVRADLSDSKARNLFIEQIGQAYPSLNLLVNTAGIAPKQRLDLLETTEESFDNLIDTNLKSQFFISQGVAKIMIKNQTSPAAIVNVSSVSATVASLNRGEYCISKAGIAMSTQLFALRLAAYGIGVYETRPGIIATDMTAAVTEKYDALIANGLIPQNRWGQAHDIGKVVSSIAKGHFDYSTGNIFMVDGGLTLSQL